MSKKKRGDSLWPLIGLGLVWWVMGAPGKLVNKLRGKKKKGDKKDG